MRFAASLRVVAMAALLGLAAVAPAGAESQISDAKLQAFVTAAVSASKVIEQWTPRIESAKDQEAIESLLAQANVELVAAIEETGEITLQEYKQISQAAQADPGLSARIEEFFKQEVSQ